jgi:hypothetical protein
VLRVARERNGVTNVLETSDETDQTLKAQTEARMGNGTESSEVEVPGVRLGVQANTLNSALEDVISLLTLRTTNNLTDLHS